MKSKPKMKSVLGQLCSVLCLGSIFICTNSSAQEQPFLKGSVEQYAAESKPLDPLLWPGNEFNKQAARSLLRNPEQEASIWHRIPEWESGKWEGNQAVNIRAIKYINGVPVARTPIGVHTAAGQFTKGLLKDKAGDIWHWFQSDYWTETDQGEKKVMSYVQYSSPGGGEFPDFYAETVDFNVDKASNKIASLRRARVWTRYVNLGPGTIKEETLRTGYDEQGHPTATSINTAIEKRIEPFSNYAAGFAARKDIVQSFHSYLKQHGMAKLIPQ